MLEFKIKVFAFHRSLQIVIATMLIMPHIIKGYVICHGLNTTLILTLPTFVTSRVASSIGNTTLQLLLNK